MITSQNQVFSDHQAITATAASTNYIDLGAVGTPVRGNPLTRDIGKGQPVPLLIQVTETFNTLTSLKVDVQVAATSAFSSPKTLISETILLADLVAGKKVNFQVLPDGVDQRYLRINYTVAGSPPTTGKVFAAIVMSRQTA